MINNRKRRIGSIKKELLVKSREAALAAVQIFNNPNITFKSECYIVLMIIAWTYLMHAYYRDKKVDYRYFKMVNNRKRFDKTKNKAKKHWELERCLNDRNSPIDKNTCNNLNYLIKLRHEIEHQMTSSIDDYFSAKYQACCINYNHYIKKLFGDDYSIDKQLSFSLQFCSIFDEQRKALPSAEGLPSNIRSFITDFENKLTKEEYESPLFAYRILFVPKTANRKGQADQVIEFIKSDTPLAENANKTYALIKETERPKHKPKWIVEKMKQEGYGDFNITKHSCLWQSLDGKNPSKGFGVSIENS